MAPEEPLLCSLVSTQTKIPNVERRCRDDKEEQDKDENPPSPDTDGPEIAEQVQEPPKQPERN